MTAQLFFCYGTVSSSIGASEVQNGADMKWDLKYKFK